MCLVLRLMLEMGMNNAGSSLKRLPLTSSSWKTSENRKELFYLSGCLSLLLEVQAFLHRRKGSGPRVSVATRTSHGIVARLLRQTARTPQEWHWPRRMVEGRISAICPVRRLSGRGEIPKAEVTNHCRAAAAETVLYGDRTPGSSNHHYNRLLWWDPAGRVPAGGKEEETSGG